MMSGYKSIIGLVVYVIGVILSAVGQHEVGSSMQEVGLPLFGLGIVHKHVKIEQKLDQVKKSV